MKGILGQTADVHNIYPPFSPPPPFISWGIIPRTTKTSRINPRATFTSCMQNEVTSIVFCLSRFRKKCKCILLSIYLSFSLFSNSHIHTSTGYPSLSLSLSLSHSHVEIPISVFLLCCHIFVSLSFVVSPSKSIVSALVLFLGGMWLGMFTHTCV